MFLELDEMRVYRPFVGGKLLDVFCGSNTLKDDHYPERWICSTTQSSDNTGLSCTKDGEILKSLILHPLDILVKLIDSYTRLMIQVHPNKENALKYFDYPSGKTECWYVIDTRIINDVKPYVFVGFKAGVTKKEWIDIFEKQDIKQMENCLHKIEVKKGDAFFIPSGVPHAMGSGVFFAEVQEPSDITLRTEWMSPDNRKMTEFDLNHGASFNDMFNCFDYDGASLEETLHKYMVKRNKNYIINSPKFTLEEIEIPIESEYEVAPKKYAIVIVIEGKNKGKEYYLDEPHVFCGKTKILVCQGAKR